MPSPFPGKDPYLEGPHWLGFHLLLCAEICRQLATKLSPKYVALPDEWLAMEAVDEITIASGTVQPDVTVVRESKSEYDTATLVPPIQMNAPLDLPAKIRFVEIRKLDGMEVVTLIELLSMANKCGRDREKYLAKRRHEI